MIVQVEYRGGLLTVRGEILQSLGLWNRSVTIFDESDCVEAG
jgi:hypothetical protein